MGVAYVDASAIVKLVVAEAESAALHRWFVEADELATSRIGVIETIRAARRVEHDEAQRERVLAMLAVVELDSSIARVAAAIAPGTLRTLDAIHLATALALLPDLDAFVTYDDRLADAARAIGLPVIRPF
jgi:uncharacterized protein